MRVRLSKDSKQFKMMGDYWALMQDVWGVEETAEYREDACRKINAFLLKYPESFAEGLTRTLIDELDRREREIRRYG